MFKEEELNEFINRMFNNAVNSNSDVKVGLTTFRKYLEETNMCTKKYLKKIDIIISCIDELIALKLKINDLDIMTIIDTKETNEEKTIEPKAPQKKIEIKPSYDAGSSNHRIHYVESYSNSCGGGSSRSRGC